MKKIIFIFAVLAFAFSCKTQNTQNGQDTTLKTLVIKRNSGMEKTISPVPLNYDYELKNDITDKNHLIVEAIANDPNATIHFDREANHRASREYKVYKPKIFIVVKNGGSSSTYTININKAKKDIGLQSLTIKQAETLVNEFKEPVSLTNTVRLHSIVSGINYLTVEAKPKDSSSSIYFDDESVARTTKGYTKSQAQIKIKVKKGKEEKEYTLNIEEPEDITGIQKLVIKQDDVVLKEFNSSIPKVINVDLREKVSSTEFVMFEVTPKIPDAEVLFDGNSSSSKTKKYESYQKLVRISVKKDSKETEYLVNLREPEIPEPKNYSVKCNVVDSMGGTNVEAASIKAYEVGNNIQLEEKTTDKEGNAYFSLQGDKYYTFIISKQGSAASRVESVYVPSNRHLFLPIIMRDMAKGALAISPEVSDIIMRHNGNETKLEPKHEIDFSNVNGGTVLNITVKSRSKKIIPEMKTDSQNFGIAMTIDSPFTINSSAVISPSPVPNGSGATITIEPDGTITQKFSVSVNKLVAEDGDATLYFTIYDIAGNRCERHQRVTFKNAQLKRNENPSNRFLEFNAYSERYYRSLRTFGMPKEEGCETSARVIFMFRFDKNVVDVGRLDILRRPYQAGDITENWEVVYSQHYEKNFKGDHKGTFKVSDASGSLRDGEVYQYKLEAYSSKGKIESPVATIKIMEAFNIFLETPKNRSEIALSNIENQNFAFKISKKSLWETSDYFYFDVLLNAEDTYGAGSTYGLMFASMLKYHLGNKKDLEVAHYASQFDKKRIYKRYTDYNPSTTNLENLIKYENGTVTLTNKFFNEANFNIERMSLKNKITKGGMYYWDIQYIGEDPLGVRDDMAAFFVKEYPCLDSKTGKPIENAKSYSYSYSNLDIIGGAINGKALFIVK